MSALHFVLCDTGFGPEWIARDPKDMTREETIKDIATGQVGLPLQVIEADLSTLTSRDASMGIAAEVMATWADAGRELDRYEYDYILGHFGFGAANAFRRAA